MRCSSFMTLMMLALAIQPRSVQGQTHLWQLDSRGDAIFVIDHRGGEVVDEIHVGPEPHGIAAPDDFHVVYVSLEANSRDRGELLWIDPSSRRVTHRLDVGPEPHEIATTPDGRWVYVPCRDGTYWVVDAVEKRVVKRIHTGGRPHNTLASEDGRFVYLSPMGDPKRVFIVDAEGGHVVVDHIDFGGSLRPPAISESRQLFFQHVDGLHGFEAADLRTRRAVATVEHPGELGWFLLPVERLGWIGPKGLQRCHGLDVRPAADEIWSVCGERVHIHSLDADSFPHVDSVPLPAHGYWLTFTADGRYAFVALGEQGRVVMVEAQKRRVVWSLPAGRRPKRNLVVPALTAASTG